MAFGNIATFYIPSAANAGASLWGTDVRKLLDAADAASDATSKTDHSTGGAVVRTVDPYTTTTADSDQTLFGWAIAPTDMGSVSGALRFFPAGNHTVTVRMGHNGATMVTGTLLMYVYRVGPAAGRTRTLLGSSSATFNLPSASAEVTATVTTTLSEVVFAADETVQYAFEVNCAGIAAVGRIVTFFAGTQSGVAARLDTPTLRVLADTTGTATGTGTASATTGKVLATIGSATGTGTAAGVGASRADTTGTASGVGTATGSGSSVAGTTGTATGSGTATGLASIVLGTTGTVSIGSGAADFAGSDPSETIAGVVYDSSGATVSGATVTLFRQSDNLAIETTTSAGDGTYAFVRDSADPNTYYVVGYSDETHHGTSDRSLLPT